ncbi:hypothetical protein CYMTET_52678 [Cymbomonas tetramitiformis]|uniref:Magnesium transporter MgtE intracellular domain-containing protein n=1 Tax=Cymbomonas tetramitiformis TaxID=36881 RepID=A0AAE0BJY7_9CHLO|nr:hypothetical protein CYMTET_52678 [Cymbomonas tetramitiformis]
MTSLPATSLPFDDSGDIIPQAIDTVPYQRALDVGDSKVDKGLDASEQRFLQELQQMEPETAAESIMELDDYRALAAQIESDPALLGALLPHLSSAKCFPTVLELLGVLSPQVVAELLGAQEPQVVAPLLSALPAEHSAGLLRGLPAADSARVLAYPEMDSRHVAALLLQLEPAEMAAILEEMDPAVAAEVTLNLDCDLERLLLAAKLEPLAHMLMEMPSEDAACVLSEAAEVKVTSVLACMASSKPRSPTGCAQGPRSRPGSVEGRATRFEKGQKCAAAVLQRFEPSRGVRHLADMPPWMRARLLGLMPAESATRLILLMGKPDQNLTMRELGIVNATALVEKVQQSPMRQELSGVIARLKEWLKNETPNAARRFPTVENSPPEEGAEKNISGAEAGADPLDTPAKGAPLREVGNQLLLPHRTPQSSGSASDFSKVTPISAQKSGAMSGYLAEGYCGGSEGARGEQRSASPATSGPKGSPNAVDELSTVALFMSKKPSMIPRLRHSNPRADICRTPQMLVPTGEESPHEAQEEVRPSSANTLQQPEHELNFHAARPPVPVATLQKVDADQVVASVSASHEVTANPSALLTPEVSAAESASPQPRALSFALEHFAAVESDASLAETPRFSQFKPLLSSSEGEQAATPSTGRTLTAVASERSYCDNLINLEDTPLSCLIPSSPEEEEQILSLAGWNSNEDEDSWLISPPPVGTPSSLAGCQDPGASLGEIDICDEIEHSQRTPTFVEQTCHMNAIFEPTEAERNEIATCQRNPPSPSFAAANDPSSTLTSLIQEDEACAMSPEDMRSAAAKAAQSVADSSIGEQEQFLSHADASCVGFRDLLHNAVWNKAIQLKCNASEKGIHRALRVTSQCSLLVLGLFGGVVTLGLSWELLASSGDAAMPPT